MQYKRQSGATLVEALYILPLFFSIMFGMMEMTFVYKAKNTLNLATQEAVRKGSFKHATQKSIEDALYKGMAPLYAAKTSICPGAPPLVAAGDICAQLVQTAINGETTGKFKTAVILSPSKEIYKKFEVNHNIKLPDDSVQKRQKYMPNDNLKWRDPTTVSVTIGGANRQINIQDANLLKIKTFWCQKLSVPGLDLILYNTILRHSKSPEQYYCNKLSQKTGGLSNSVFGRSRGYYIAIKSHAIARMQSAVLESTYNSSLLSSDQIVAVNNQSIPNDSEPPIVVNPPTDDDNSDDDDDNSDDDDDNSDDDDDNSDDDNSDDDNSDDDNSDDDDDKCEDGYVKNRLGICIKACDLSRPKETGCICGEDHVWYDPNK